MTSVNKRVIKDIKDGRKNLREYMGIHIAPESDMYRIHFILPGPSDTPYYGGLYHGFIRLSPRHPMCPPTIHMITKSGRFKTENHPIPATSRGICTTASAFHPETWTVLNNIESVIKGFLSLMCDDYDGAVGSVNDTVENRKKYAVESIESIADDPVVMELFPDLHEVVSSGNFDPDKPFGMITNHREVVSVEIDDSCDSNDNIDARSAPSRKTKTKTKTKTKKAKKAKVVIIESDSEDSESEHADPPQKKSRSKTKTNSKKLIPELKDSDSEHADHPPKKSRTKTKTKAKVVSKRKKQ